MASQKQKSDLMSTLRRRGLNLTFAGRVFTDWTCVQLRELLNLFDPAVLDTRTWPKIEYCKLLLELKPTLTQ